MTVFKDKIVVNTGEVEYICNEITITGNTNIISIYGKNIKYTENGNNALINARPIQIFLLGKNEFEIHRNNYKFVAPVPSNIPDQLKQNPKIFNHNGNLILVKF